MCFFAFAFGQSLRDRETEKRGRIDNQNRSEVENLRFSRHDTPTSPTEMVPLTPLKKTEALNKRIQELERENKRLREENKDMKQFLKDYGMVWVGKRCDADTIDHDTFLKKLRKLNETAIQQQQLVVQQICNGAILSYPESVPLCVYKDAMEVCGAELIDCA